MAVNRLLASGGMGQVCVGEGLVQGVPAASPPLLGSRG